MNTCIPNHPDSGASSTGTSVAAQPKAAPPPAEGGRSIRPEHVNPFIDGVETLFATMLGCPVERGKLSLASRSAEGDDITALIGISGPGPGTIALCFPMVTAKKMVCRLMDSADAEGEVEDTVTDGVAELVNIVAGQAKAKFQGADGTPLTLSLPTVIRGSAVLLATPPRVAWLDVPFRSELGPFHLRVSCVLKS